MVVHLFSAKNVPRNRESISRTHQLFCSGDRHAPSGIPCRELAVLGLFKILDRGRRALPPSPLTVRGGLSEMLNYVWFAMQRYPYIAFTKGGDRRQAE